MATRNANTMYVPIFTEKSQSVQSPFFYVSPGTIVQAQAFGFVTFASRMDNTERRVPQVACLEQVLFKEGVRLDGTTDDCHCTKIYDLSRFTTEVLECEEVMLNGCGVNLSACKNQILINLPGAYRFVLNDQTAIGNARIYLRTYSSAEFPWNSSLFIGA